MFIPDKTKLNEAVISEYKTATTAKNVALRLGASYDPIPIAPIAHEVPSHFENYTTRLRIGEALAAYESDQAYSRLPELLRHHIGQAIAILERFILRWQSGNDKSMTICQHIEHAKGMAETIRKRLDPCFTICRLGADPEGEYHNAYNKYEYIYLGLLKCLQEYVRNETAVCNAKNYRKELKAAIIHVLEAEVLPKLQEAIPLLKDMKETLAPV
jgi:hypothetical protein